MFEGTFRLLKMEAKLVVATLGFGLAVLTGAFRGATWLVRRISRRPAPTQAPASASPSITNQPTAPSAQLAPAAPIAAPAGTHVSVTVNTNLGGFSPPPAPALPERMDEGGAPDHHLPAEVLARPDHGIWITTGSHLMMAHPHAEYLLRQLDKMLYMGAHRDGSPWTLPPAPDTSEPLQGAAQITAVARPDDGFDTCTVRPLPAVDGAVWLARAGQDFERRVGS